MYNKLTTFIIWHSLNIITINGVNNVCNDKYCLYHVGDVNAPNMNPLEQAKSLCSQNNSHSWPFEVYNEQVNQLVDRFFGKTNLRERYIFLGTRLLFIPWNWFWVNKMPGNLKNLFLILLHHFLN